MTEMDMDYSFGEDVAIEPTALPILHSAEALLLPLFLIISAVFVDVSILPV